jgi:dihydroxyacetone kinase-like protein
MKKLINDPEDVVKESLLGVEVAHPEHVKVHYDPNYVYRADHP